MLSWLLQIFSFRILILILIDRGPDLFRQEGKQVQMKGVEGKPWKNYSETLWNSRKSGMPASGISGTKLPKAGSGMWQLSKLTLFLVTLLGLSEHIFC